MKNFTIALMANRYSDLPLGTAAMITKVESANKESARREAAIKFLKGSGFPVSERVDDGELYELCEEMGFNLKELNVKQGDHSFPYTNGTYFIK
jgi:hypothetical protein